SSASCSGLGDTGAGPGAPTPGAMLMGSVGRAPRAGGLLGLLTLKPLRSGLSLQSIVAPRSFSTLSAAITMSRSPSCWTTLSLPAGLSGSSDSAQVYSPSAKPVTPTDNP